MIYWNTRRICSDNGVLPPMTKRKQYYESLEQAAPTAKSKNSVTELYFDWLNEWVEVEGWIIFLNYTNQNNWIIAESLTLPNQQKVKNTIS